MSKDWSRRLFQQRMILGSCRTIHMARRWRIACCDTCSSGIGAMTLSDEQMVDIFDTFVQ